MKADKKTMLLYAVTDRAWLGGRRLEDDVEKALRGGATFLQIREKELDDAAFLEQAKAVKAVAGRYGVPFVVNDNVAVAKAVDADGVHVGQSDMEAGDVRAQLGPDKIIGVSVQTVEQAVLAEKRGADYLGVGAVFPTATKQDAAEVSFETLREICGTVSIPVVAIGGIHSENIMELAGSGIAGVAVVSAIFAAADIESAAAELAAKAREVVKE